MNELWLISGILFAILGVTVLAAIVGAVYLHVRFLDPLVRIFQERPLFIIPRGKSFSSGEEVRFPGPDGLTLRGWYLPTTAAQRRGVILFGLEFGSTCEASQSYCEDLVERGFDVFTFEPRNQGKSEKSAGYEPLQWVTDYEVADCEAAIRYLKNRPDADPNGIGFFGISKGAGAGILAAAADSSVRCCVTDGVFATHTTMVPYMRKWVSIYSDLRWIQEKLPEWVYAWFASAALRRIEKLRNCRFSHLERAVGKLAPRALLMIHGSDDTYIKTDMAESLFDQAGQPKEFWLVEGAKHNQALHVAGDEYRRRVLEFFQRNLTSATEAPATMQAPIPSPDWQPDAVPAFHT